MGTQINYQRKMKISLVASVAANVALCVALVCLVSYGSQSSLGAPVMQRARAAAFSRAVTPAPTFRSAVAQAYCEEVVDPANNLKFETMSYMPDFGNQDIANQVNYMIGQGLIPCIEFDSTEGGVTHRENSRMPGYYDNRYWTMWKLPLFGATDASSVLAEIAECKKSNPKAYIRVLGFDNMKQVQCMGFLVSKPSAYGF